VYYIHTVNQFPFNHFFIFDHSCMENNKKHHIDACMTSVWCFQEKKREEKKE